MKRRAIWGCLCVFCALSAAADYWRQNPPHWRFWQAVDGLGESCSNSVFIGPSGRVWVNHGHIDRMSVLDGYSVENIPSPGVGAHVYVSASGEIWSIYKNGFKKYIYHNQLTDGKWIEYPVEDIQTETTPFFPIADGGIAYLLPDRLMRFDPSTHQSEVLFAVSDSHLDSFNDLLAARNGDLWLAGRNGAAVYQGKEYLFDPALNLQDLNDLQEGGEGIIFGTAYSPAIQKRVLVRWHQGEWKIVYQNPEQDVLRGWGDESRFWVFEPSFQLSLIEGKQTTKVDRNKVLSRILIDLDVEPNGTFWLATSEGLARYASAAWRTPPETMGMDNVVHAIQEDRQGHLWFLFARQLAVLQESTWAFYALPDAIESNELITEALCFLADGRLLLKTTSGLLLFDPQTKSFQPALHPNDFTIVLIASRGGEGVWVVSYGSGKARLETFDGQTFQTVIEQNDYRYLDPDLRHVYQDRQGAIWLAGLNGLVRYRNGEFHRFTAQEGFADTAAYCIHPVGENRLWVGGRDALLEYDGARWTLLRSGLDSVRSMMTESDGSLWAASGTGLHRYNDGSWVDMTYEEGLPNAAAFEIYQDSQDRIWAGTTSGLSLYHPNADPDAPRTIIPSDINAAEIAPNGAIFAFQGVDKWNYTPPDRMLFSYRIDDGAWSPFASETAARIPRLPAGKHRFEVRAMDRNWNIDPHPAVHPFIVLLPWYKEPLFLGIIMAGTIVLTISLYFHFSHYRNLGRLVALRTTALTQANEQLKKDARDLRSAYDRVLQFQKQLQALASELSLVEERERRRLAADLHDSIGQTLSLSMIKLEALRESLAALEQSQQVDAIKELIEQTLQNSRDLTFELCPPILYEVGFEAAIEQLADQIRRQHGIRIDCAIDSQLKSMPEDLQYVLFRAARELLTNIVKHARVNQADLIIRNSAESVRIEAADHGAGFDPASLSLKSEGFGLFSIRERLHQIGGKLTVESRPGQGTRMIIEAPIRPE
ncbi:MAG: histidine kinase [Candidatus Omnitrophota bacterium]